MSVVAKPGIATCNRVEVYGVVPDGALGDQVLCSFLADWHHIAPEDLAPQLVTCAGADAARHLFRLAAGLDSLVLGEDQIMGQLKGAFVAAHSTGMTGPLLTRLVDGALAAGKLVRTQTGIARHQLSTVSMALDRARQILGSLTGRNVLVVGAGRMAELALKHLRGDAPAAIGIANRTLDRAQTLAARYGATAWPLDQLAEALRQADVVVSCTAAPEIVIDADVVARALAARPARAREARAPLLPGSDTELLLLDLAVPRDIDRAAARPGVRLLDVDDLHSIGAANYAARVAEVAQAEALVAGEVQTFMAWWAARDVVPTIRALRERAEAIRQSEVARTLAKLPELSEREQQAILALSTAIVNKILHQPVVALKDLAGGGELAQAAQRLFHLNAPIR